MCGIVGLFLKNAAFEPQLGQLTARMLSEMSDRGPDSAGFAVYGQSPPGETKICMVANGASVDWRSAAAALAAAIGAEVDVEPVSDHAIFRTAGDGAAARKWLIDHMPGATVLSQGRTIEIFKGVGAPDAI